jgi:hypothetical protein
MPERFDPLADLRSALIAEDRCAAHPPLTRRTQSIEEAQLLWESVQECAPHKQQEHLRWLARNDLWFLLTYLLKIEDVFTGWRHQWFFDRCAEVQDAPNNHLDFWSRGGGKSTIITRGKTIQDILIDPNTTICILSHTRPIAKRFLAQIKIDLETCERLKALFPDILYAEPHKESPRWSLDDGIVVKRPGNPKEATVEAWGMIDGMPTSGHYAILLYDDVITEKAVTTPEMIDKVTSQWELSLNLAATDPIRFRVAGTFYADGDTYQVMMERGFGTPRVRAIVKGDVSLLLSDEGLAQKKQSMSTRNWALQILLDPKQADKERGFKSEWITHWRTRPNLAALNKYIFVDPGGKGRASRSYTAMVVIGLGADKHIYVLWIVRDRLGLLERAEALFSLHREYQPLNTYYERYSMQADIEHIRDKQSRENYRFLITEVGAEGAQLDKDLRIETLQPDFGQGTILLPPMGWIKRKDGNGNEIDIVEHVVNREILPFPYAREKDVLDALSRIHDPKVTLSFPRPYGSAPRNEHWRVTEEAGGGWMSS